jgi:putative membrane protein
MRAIFFAAALSGLALPAAAQTAPSTPQFATNVAISDLFEIESSKLALEKSANAQIKGFAQMMVADHTKTSNELKSLVQNVSGVQLPTAMDADHKGKVDQLRAATGSAFDQQYRLLQIDGHQKAVALFDGYAKGGDNNEIKAWAQNTVPALRQHLQRAQALPAAQAGGQQVKLTPLATPGPDHMLVSSLRGVKVYGSNDESIGDINDVLIDRTGKVSAIIVGVGGFLGLGEKDVAVPFEALEVAGEVKGASGTTGAGGTTQPNRIVLKGMTKADLQAAPNFRADGKTDRAR